MCVCYGASYIITPLDAYQNKYMTVCKKWGGGGGCVRVMKHGDGAVGCVGEGEVNKAGVGIRLQKESAIKQSSHSRSQSCSQSHKKGHLLGLSVSSSAQLYCHRHNSRHRIGGCNISGSYIKSHRPQKKA